MELLLPPGVARRLNEKAEELGVSVSDLILRAIVKLLEEEEV